MLDYKEMSKQMYKYGMRLRGYSIACQPLAGLWRVEEDKSGRYHSILFYSRPLNDHEQEAFELDYLGEVGREKSTNNLH